LVIRHLPFVIRHSSFDHSPMLSTALVHEIDRLLREGGLSQRTIAARLGVSRGIVSAIANGRRGLYGKDSCDGTLRSLAPAAPPVRCPQCGYRVYPPCLVCEARDYQHNRNGAMKKELRNHP
jgi:hypothetical protein